MQIDLSKYHPTPIQKEFHDATETLKLLLGGVGSGKSTPLYYEALMLGLEYPDNEILFGRNVEHELKKVTINDFINLCPPEIILKWEKTDKVLTLVNGTRYIFMSMNLGINAYKSLNLGAICIDEASEVDKEVSLYLLTRLRRANIPKRYMLLCSNYEGRNWLWQMFIRDRIPNSRYWIMKSYDNPYLPSDYIPMLKATHSEEWVKRYVDCSLDSFVGLVYDMFNYDKQIIDDLPLKERFPDSSEQTIDYIKIQVIDTGIIHKSVCLNVAYDVKRKRIIFYDEFAQSGISTRVLANVIKDKGIDITKRLIDPSSAQMEQTSGSSVRKDLAKDGVHCLYANRNRKLGIERTRWFIENNRFFILRKCVQTIKEIQEYSWKEGTLEEYDVGLQKEEPVKRDDDCMDCVRYACMYFYDIATRRIESQEKAKINTLPFYDKLRNIRKKRLDRSGKKEYITDRMNKI